MKLKNKFIVIIPAFNCKELIEECLTSVLMQDYEDLGIIVRDDVSTDGTDLVIQKILNLRELHNENYCKANNKDVVFIKNVEKLYPVGNTYESVLNYIEHHNSIVGVVDGDDKLLTSQAIKKISKIYDEHDKWFVWSQHVKSNGSIGESKPLPKDNVIYSSRNYWSASHFRTSKAFLYSYLNPKDLKDPWVANSYYTFSGDAAFLFPFCEMCGNAKSYFLDEVLYHYNCHLPTNEQNKSFNDAVKYGSFIRTNGKKYLKLLPNE